MLRRAWHALAERPARGLAASIVLHVVVVGLALFMALPVGQYTVKRGEPLFIELPELPEPAPAGNPAARSAGPPLPERPPATLAQPAPRPRSATPAAPAPPPLATPAAPAPPPAATPPVAAPLVASRPTTPSPPVVEPPPAGLDEPIAPAPEQPAAAPPEPLAPPAPEAAPSAPPRVAAVLPPAVPPPTVAPPVDIRSALGRGGGAGSAHGGGRGGIEGEPIPLDSPNAKYNDYLERLRQRIKANWGFPCVKDEATLRCDYKTTSLVVHFGILKDGSLQFVEVVRSSGYPIYDDYAVNAIKFSSPFPAVPPTMIVAMKQNSTGVAIMAQFNYLVDTSLTNLLR